MDNRPVGIFDSGLGGITAVRALQRLMPNEQIVYFGDTSRVPYGTRSRETIQKYAMQDIRFLLSNDVKMIVAACGTVSTNPPPKELLGALPVPYTNVISPAVTAACAATKNGKIGVIATDASIQSHAYNNSIAAINPDFSVYSKASPLLVPLIENGYIDKQNPVTRMVAMDYLSPLLSEGIDTLILGCTHYPIIKSLLADLVGPDIRLIDTGEECAKAVQSYLLTNGLQSDSNTPKRPRFFVSDKEQNFTDKACIFLGSDITPDVKQIDIDRF